MDVRASQLFASQVELSVVSIQVETGVMFSDNFTNGEGVNSKQLRPNADHCGTLQDSG